MNKKRCGYVALVGAPNAGKSTLLNALARNKLAIVTPKPQTTRFATRGIVNYDDSQVVFIDTPGIFDAKFMFEQAMVDCAWNGMNEADVVLLVIDANRGIDFDTQRIIEKFKHNKIDAVLVLNKVDKVEKSKLPVIAKELYDMYDFSQSFMVSARKGDGVKDITHYLASHMPEAEWMYPGEEATDVSERSLAEEITREECFLKLHAELPYELMVETEKWEEKKPAPRTHKRTVVIHQNIVTQRETHKKIILGKSGAMLKAISQTARKKMGPMLGAEVHLYLFVKVKETWKEDPAMFKAIGLEYKKTK